MDYLRYLKDTDIFYKMRSEHLQASVQICETREFKKEDIIVQESAPSEALYVIVEGWLSILVDPKVIASRDRHTSSPTDLVTLRSGQTFGELGLVDQGLRSAAVPAASTPTHLLAIHR